MEWKTKMWRKIECHFLCWKNLQFYLRKKLEFYVSSLTYFPTTFSSYFISLFSDTGSTLNYTGFLNFIPNLSRRYIFTWCSYIFIESLLSIYVRSLLPVYWLLLWSIHTRLLLWSIHTRLLLWSIHTRLLLWSIHTRLLFIGSLLYSSLHWSLVSFLKVFYNSLQRVFLLTGFKFLIFSHEHDDKT